MINRALIAAALSLVCAGAFAQTTAANSIADTTQRDVHQQARIENGLKTGALSTREAAGLEKEQAHIDRLQAKDLKGGRLSTAERTRLNLAQNKASHDISVAKHNAVTGNPRSVSSRRLQADVARNVHEETRIAAGVKSGSLTNRETGSLEHGQAHVDRVEASAAANGHVSAAEQRRVQRAENQQSRRVHQDKTDAQVRG